MIGYAPPISKPVLIGLAALVFALVGCEATEPAASADTVLQLPAGFPAPKVPADNPITAEKAELGRYLFYDKRLSSNGTQACAGCHEQARAFTDGKARAVGSTGELHPRNSQGLANVAYAPTLTWGNPTLLTLEHQILIPIFGETPIELGVGADKDAVLARFRDDPAMAKRFAAAFPKRAEPVQWETVVAALATFVRTMISGDSPFDRYVHNGGSLSDAARRGMNLFFSERLECHHCHGGFNFSEATTHAGSGFEAALFHNTGQYNIDGKGAYPPGNAGVFEITADPADMGRFRPPSLRNVGVTAPYMHDGSVATLEQVIRNYERGGRLISHGKYAGDGAKSPLKSGLVPGFTLTDSERSDLVAFLHSLTDETFLHDPRFSDPTKSAP